jgi:competence ComEA-like helix-hairpin-helix protein
VLDILKSERYFLLVFLTIGLICAGISYNKKTAYHFAIRIDISEPHVLLIDINTASEAQLMRLPGIGPHLAEEIIAYRQKSCGFKAPEELKNIKGIGNKKFERIKDLISIGE